MDGRKERMRYADGWMDRLMKTKESKCGWMDGGTEVGRREVV